MTAIVRFSFGLCMESTMNARIPINTLEEKLATARLQAIEDLARAAGPIESSTDGVARVALLHATLMAVRDAIAAQQPHLGSGGEQPLD
jgi:hypothetical protein